jgi:hypothetical protein
MDWYGKFHDGDIDNFQLLLSIKNLGTKHYCNLKLNLNII